MDVKRRPRISLDLLRSFEAAARHLSFTLAAKELCITQSAVSRQMLSLEEQCSKTLFVRANRGLRLTESGQSLFAAVTQAHGLVDDAFDQLNDASSRPPLVVGTATPFASLLLVPALPRFLAIAPEQSVRLVSTNEPLELERLHAHIVIRHFRPGAAPTNAIWLADDTVLPVCAPKLIGIRSTRLVETKDLQSHCLLRYETVINGRVKIDWARWLLHNGLSRLKPNAVLSFTQYEQAVQAALEGVGVALGRLPLVSRQLAEGRLLAPFANSEIQTGAWYALLNEHARSLDAAQKFVTWLISETNLAI